jgi:hypothetical protein
MSEIKASIWFVSFSGTPPYPNCEEWTRDGSWADMASLRSWLSKEMAGFGYEKGSAVFIVFRDGHELVLTYEQAAHPEPDMDAIKTREINVLVEENRRLIAALRPFATMLDPGSLDNVGGGTLIAPTIKVQMVKAAKAALSPNTPHQRPPA